MQAPPQTQPTSFFGGVSETVSKKFDGSYLMESKGLKYAVYALMLGIVAAVVVLLIDTFFPFLPVSPMGPSSAARAGKVFWSSGPADAENLVVPAALSPTVSPSNYTMSVQIMIGDSRTPSLGHFRHIVHRGSNPCALPLPLPLVAGPTGHAGIQASDITEIIKSDPQYLMKGLPAIMNPGVFLDEYKNDIHVFIHTKGKEDTMEVLWLESLTIEDLPLATPITLGIVCNKQMLEVYVNCKLYSTLMLKGVPYLPKADNQWFGRYCAFPMSGLVKNLELWSSALGSTDYLLMCRGASFDKNQLPSTCPTANGGTCANNSAVGAIKSLVSGNGISSQQKDALLSTGIGALI